MVWALALLKVGCTIFMGTDEVYSFCLAMFCLFLAYLYLLVWSHF